MTIIRIESLIKAGNKIRLSKFSTFFQMGNVLSDAVSSSRKKTLRFAQLCSKSLPNINVTIKKAIRSSITSRDIVFSKKQHSWFNVFWFSNRGTVTSAEKSNCHIWSIPYIHHDRIKATNQCRTKIRIFLPMLLTFCRSRFDNSDLVIELPIRANSNNGFLLGNIDFWQSY